MRVAYEALYHLSLTSHEVHVLLTYLHGGTVEEADQPVLQHLRQGLLQGIAGSLHTERARFFTPAVPSPLRPTPPSVTPTATPEPAPASETPAAVLIEPAVADAPPAGDNPEPPSTEQA